VHLLYTDASGTPELQDHSKEYVVVGVALPDSAWQKLDSEVFSIKQRYGLLQTRAELHARDFCVSFTEQDEIPDFQSLGWNERRAAVVEVRARKLREYTGAKRARKAKSFEETGPYVHLTRTERSALLQDVLDAVGGFGELVLFAEAVRKSHASADIVSQAFTQVVSRFDSFLERKNQRSRRTFERLCEKYPKLKREAAELGPAEKGLLIMDEEPAREASYRTMLASFRDSGHPWGQLKHVIEAPFFVDSSLSAAVQVADICAYAIRRYVEHGPSKGTAEEANFKRIFGRFDRGAKLHGIRHYCAKGTCECLVCNERGHSGAP
jgi:hypothetical protein